MIGKIYGFELIKNDLILIIINIACWTDNRKTLCVKVVRIMRLRISSVRGDPLGKMDMSFSTRLFGTINVIKPIIIPLPKTKYDG